MKKLNLDKTVHPINHRKLTKSAVLCIIAIFIISMLSVFAAAPVQAATTPSFGNTAIGTNTAHNDANAQSVSYFTATTTGTITDIIAYTDGQTTGNCMAALYAVSGGSASNLLEQTSSVSISTTFSWVDFQLPSAYSVTSGTTYGLAIMGNVAINIVEVAGTGQRDHNAVSSYTNGFANPFGIIWGTDKNGAMSIYAATTTSTPTPTPTPIATPTPGPTASPAPAPTLTWTTKAVLPVSRADPPAVTYNNLLYVFGGYQISYSGGTSQVYAYNPSTDSWTQKASMNVATWGSAAAVYNGVAYVFGGVDGANGTTVQAYNFASNSWTTKNALPANLAGQGEMAVTVGSSIYVFGGWNGTGAYSYNPSTDSYAQLANIPFITRWGTCAYVNVNGQDRIYIMGGFSYVTGDGVNTMYYYRPAYNDWTYAGTTPYPAYGTLRDDPVINGLIYYGYGQKSGVYFSNLYSYNPNTASWSSALPQGAYPRDGVACGVINGDLYVVGGRNSSPSGGVPGLNYNEQFDPENTLPVNISPTQVTMHLGQSQTTALLMSACFL